MAAWGQQTWGFENWGTLGDQTVVLSSTNLSASFSIGAVTIDNEIQIGWGGDTWGENEWGDLSGSQPTITGIQSAFSIGSVTTTANADVDASGIQLTATNAGAVGGTSVDLVLTGLELTLTGGEETYGIGVPVTGSQASTSAGQTTIDPTYLIGEGWGRDTWGNLGWGVNYSAAPSMAQLDISLGDENAFTDVDVTVTSPNALSITYASPAFSIQIDQDIFVLASEDQIDASVGSVVNTADANVSVSGIQSTSSIGIVVAGLFLDVPVTGSEISMTLGDFSLEQSTNETATGQELTSSLGNAEEIPGQIIGLSGFEITSSIGSVTVTATAEVQPTGNLANISTGSVSTQGWNEIDPGVNNIWSDVDLAA